MVCPLALVGALALTGCSSSASSPAASQTDFCTLVIAYKTANQALGNDLATGSAATVKAALKQVLGQVQVLQQRAPAAVKTDIDTAAGFITSFDALMAKYSYDIAVAQANPAAATELEALNSDEVNAALQRIGTYRDTQCAAPDDTSAVTPVTTNETTPGT